MFYTLTPERNNRCTLYNKQLTLNEERNNTISKIGKENMYKDSAFQYNCQCMVKDILESNGLYSNDINKFVYQPLESVVKNVNKYAPIVANAITNTSGGNKLIMEAELKKRSTKDLKSILREQKKVFHPKMTTYNNSHCQAHLLADLITIPLMYNLILWNNFL